MKLTPWFPGIVKPVRDSGFWGRVAARQASRIKQLEAAVQQALEAMLSPGGAQACSTCQDGPENEYCCRREMWSAVDALRAALVQQAEPVEPVATLTAQRDALLEALKTYGWHTEDCPQYPTHARPKNWPACTCGFDAAIKAVEEGK